MVVSCTNPILNKIARVGLIRVNLWLGLKTRTHCRLGQEIKGEIKFFFPAVMLLRESQVG